MAAHTDEVLGGTPSTSGALGLVGTDPLVYDSEDDDTPVSTPPYLIRAQADIQPAIPRSMAQVRELVRDVAALSAIYPGSGQLIGMVGGGMLTPEHTNQLVDAFIDSLPAHHPAKGRFAVP